MVLKWGGGGRGGEEGEDKLQDSFTDHLGLGADMMAASMTAEDACFVLAAGCPHDAGGMSGMMPASFFCSPKALAYSRR